MALELLRQMDDDQSALRQGKYGSKATSLTILREDEIQDSDWLLQKTSEGEHWKVLEDAGLDPGPIDGKLGRKTRSALSKIKVEFPELGSLPKLSIHNASVYCRNIGLMRESRVGWVSDKEIIRIVTGDQIVDSDVVKLKAILEDLNRFYIKEYNVKLPGEIILVLILGAKLELIHLVNCPRAPLLEL